MKFLYERAGVVSDALELGIDPKIKWMACVTIRICPFSETVSFWGVGKTKADARRHTIAKFNAWRAGLNRVKFKGGRS